MTLTTEMIRAGQDTAPQLSAVEIAAVWRAMCAAAPVAAQAQPEGVTLDGCLETLYRLGEYLGVDYAASRKAEGAPSGVYIKAIEAKIANAQQPVSGADGLPYFAHKIIEKLARADECFSEGEGADIGRHWLDMLTRLGLLNRVQINPAIWEITVQGEEVLHGHSNRL